MRVYLAGGFRSGWQDRVIEEAPECEFIDPRSHELKDEATYTAWDLEAIRRCDVVFAYLEQGNPGGPNLGLEIGYAKALGKIVIYVEDERWRYTGMLRAVADSAFHSFDVGLIELRHKARWLS